MPDSLPHPDLVAALPRLRRYARVLTGDLNRADDLVQDTLARAWEKRRLWQPGSDLRAWLFTIMHNVHVNQFALRRRELSESSMDADDGPVAGWEIPVRATQSDRLELAEVFGQIGRLPVEQREVLILAAVEELRYEEIARVQCVPIGTVMSRLNRAREKLRRMTGMSPVAAESDQMSSNLPLSDDDVHAYADGKLPEARRAMLVAALERDPALAARVAAIREQNVDAARRVRSVAGRAVAARADRRGAAAAGKEGVARGLGDGGVGQRRDADHRRRPRVDGPRRSPPSRRHADDVSAAGRTDARALCDRPESAGRDLGQRRRSTGALAFEAAEFSAARAESACDGLRPGRRQAGRRQRKAGRAVHVRKCRQAAHFAAGAQGQRAYARDRVPLRARGRSRRLLLDRRRLRLRAVRQGRQAQLLAIARVVYGELAAAERCAEALTPDRKRRRASASRGLKFA